MPNIPTRRLAATAVAAIVLMTLVLLGNNSPLRDVAGAISHPPVPPTPTRAVPPENGQGSKSGPAITPPGSDPPWLVAGPSFSNVVLHWTSHAYRTMPGNPTSASSQVVNGEYWVRIGPDGTILRAHEYFTQADGSFHQETVYTDGSTSTVWGSYPRPPQAEGTCPVTGSSPPPPGPRPEFAANAETLAQQGFTPHEGLTQLLPATTTIPGVEPIEIYAAGDVIQVWERHDPRDNGSTVIRRLGAGAHDRVVLAESTVIDESGTVLSEMRATLGDLKVYASASMPDAVFELFQPGQGDCDAR